MLRGSEIQFALPFIITKHDCSLLIVVILDSVYCLPYSYSMDSLEIFGIFM